MNKRVLIIGAGYVGFSLSLLMAKDNKVLLLDSDSAKLTKLKNKESINSELECERLLHKNFDNLSFINWSQLDSELDLVILCLPTNYNESSRSFDTSILESVIERINKIVSDTPILIRSTIPIGFTKEMNNLSLKNPILFSPEFLREGFSIYDNQYPSRIVISRNQDQELWVAELLNSISLNNPKILFMKSDEAEAVKLFSNTYLASRIAFFNEIDSFCLEKELDAMALIKGISADDRIGDYYNNPSFGYGGYCLPKDSMQTLSSYNDIPQSLISATIESNVKRKKTILKYILEMNNKSIGVYRCTMKSNSDNLRESPMIDIIDGLLAAGKKVFIYEPLIKEPKFMECDVIEDINTFAAVSELIIANRLDDQIAQFNTKLFSRDLFQIN